MNQYDKDKLLWAEIERQSKIPSPLTPPLEITDETNRSLLESTVVVLGDALFAMLNIEKAALDGAEEGLDVPYHFAKVRAALKELKVRFPDLYEDAIG